MTHAATSDSHKVEFVPSGRGKAQCPSNPEYPNGIDINGAGEAAESCKVTLPYPAPECGLYRVECRLCGFSLAITAAGRPDDPKSVTLPCQLSRPGEVH